MTRSPMLAVSILAIALAAGGCTPEPEPPPPPTEYYNFSKVIDATGSPSYDVGKTAQGVTEHNEYGQNSTLTILIDVNHSNGVSAHPVAVIKYADGTTYTCEQTEIRMLDYFFS